MKWRLMQSMLWIMFAGLNLAYLVELGQWWNVVGLACSLANIVGAWMPDEAD